MKLVKPYVKYVQNKDNYEHIAKAAKICYASQMSTVDNLTFIENLWKNKGHRSPFRHGTIYLEITSSFERLVNIFVNSAYCTCVFVKEEYTWFISTNLQFIKELDAKILKTIQNFFISEEYLNEVCKKHPEVKDIIRVSFEIQTQISTSRELNRVSPNAICEQSTRFCNFANEKFGEHIAFCEPHWLDATTYRTENGEQECSERIFVKNPNKRYVLDNSICAIVGEEYLIVNEKYPIATKGIPQKDGSSLVYNPVTIGEDYIDGLLDDERRYFKYIKYGMKPQDARGILGLDCATKCFYTYSIKEWKHILDLRYKGTTGDPHPNAKIVATEIYNTLKELNLLGDYE